MRWLKREIWKASIALAGILLLLVLMVWVPVSAAGAYEGMSELATPVTGTVQTTPTVDATVTALNKEKLEQEIQQLKNQNAPDLFGWLRTNAAILLSTLVVVIGGLIGLFRWFGDRRDAQDKELRAQAEERFKTAVTALGDEKEAVQLGGAILLRSFLNPNDKEIYGRYYRQIFDLAVAYLRLPRTSIPPDDPDGLPPPPEDPNAPLRLTPFRQALIVVFKEAFPLARSQNKGSQQSLDASRVRLDHAYLKGADLNQAWMPEVSLRQADLRGAKLRGANLADTKLVEADLRGAILFQTDFSRADLSKANFSRTTSLRGANLSNTTLLGANFKVASDVRFANFTEVNLSGADLSGADLSELLLFRANLSNANLIETDLSETHLDGADLTGADLRLANLSGAWLRDAKCSGAKLAQANFSEADLSYADLSGAFLLLAANLSRANNLNTVNFSKAHLNRTDLSGADLSGANLSGADLSEVDLSLTKLSEANLHTAILSRTILHGADLQRVNLRETKLWVADLREANLSGADLGRADLREANLSGANLGGVKLEDALSLIDTILRGVGGLTKEQLEACKAKGAIIDEDSTISPPQSPASLPSSQSNDAQAPSVPSAQVNAPPPDTDGNSAVSPQQDLES